MTNGAMEVITPVQRRRRWTRAEKERIVAAALASNDHAIHRLNEWLSWSWAAEVERRKVPA